MVEIKKTYLLSEQEQFDICKSNMDCEIVTKIHISINEEIIIESMYAWHAGCACRYTNYNNLEEKFKREVNKLLEHEVYFSSKYMEVK